MFFHLVRRVGQGKILSSYEGFSRSDVLPLSYRDSTESKVYYEVHVTCVLHAARISNVDSEMFVDRNKIEIFHQNCWKDILKINADSIQV